MWLKTLSKITFFGGLLLPIIVAPIMLVPAATPRAAFILLLGVCAAVVLFFQKRETFEFGLTELLLTLYVGIFALSGIFGVNFALSLWSDGSRQLGIAHWVAWLLWFFVARREMKHEAVQRAFWWVITAEALFVAALSLGRPFIFDCDDPIRLCGSFGNPMIFADYLAPLIAVLLASWQPSIQLGMSKWYRIACMPAAVLVAMYALYLTSTRGAVLALAVGFVCVGFVRLYYFFVAMSKKKRISIVVCGIVALIIATVLILFSASLRTKIFDTLTLGRGASTLDTRFIDWQTAWRGAQEHLFLGRGPENYRELADKYFNPALQDYSYYETRVDKPHNAQLELLVSSGIVGVVAYGAFILALFLLFLRRGVQKYGIWSGAFFAAAVLVLEISLATSFETYASMSVLGYILVAGSVIEPVKFSWHVPQFLRNNFVGYPLIFIAIAGFVYGGVLPVRAAFVTQEALNRQYDGNVPAIIDTVASVYAWPVGPYQFEVWQWTSGALISGFVDHPELVRAMTPQTQVAWRAAVVAAAGRTETYLAKNYSDTKWQLFGGKEAYNAAILLDDPRQLTVAETAFTRAQILSPLRQESWDVLVYVHMLQAKYDEAIAAAVGGVRIRDTQEMSQTVDALVVRLQKEQRIDLVAQLFTQLIAVAPTADRYARLAAADASLHHYDAARAAVAQAVILDSSYATDAALFLQQLPKK